MAKKLTLRQQTQFVQNLMRKEGISERAARRRLAESQTQTIGRTRKGGTATVSRKTGKKVKPRLTKLKPGGRTAKTRGIIPRQAVLKTRPRTRFA